MTTFIGENPERSIVTNRNEENSYLVHRVQFNGSNEEKLLMDFSDNEDHPNRLSISPDEKNFQVFAKTSDLLAFDQSFLGKKVRISFGLHNEEPFLELTEFTG